MPDDVKPLSLAAIEDMSYAELKSRQDELIELAAKCKHAELAVRYVRARTDAKMRDEKLAEQAKIIKALQDAGGKSC